MRGSEGAFSPREVRLGMWVVLGALLLSAAGFVANTWLLSPSLGGYEQVAAQPAQNGVLDARPLGDVSVRAAAVTASVASAG